MRKWAILMTVAAVAMAVAAGALVAAVRYAADSTPEIATSVVGQVNAVISDSIDTSISTDPLARSLAEANDAAIGGDSAPPRVTTSTSQVATPATGQPPSDSSAIGPAAGISMAVVGVRWDNVLNVRDQPNGNIIARLNTVLGEGRGAEIDVLAPDSGAVLAVTPIDGVMATGESTQPQTVMWNRINVGGIEGWASDAYLAALGRRASELSDRLRRDLSSSEDFDTVAEIEGLAQARLQVAEPDAEQVIVWPVEFFEGSGVHWIDVLGVRDSRLRGYRVGIVIVAGGDWMVPDARTNAGPFTIRDVWATELCLTRRGSHTDGACR